MASIQKKKKKWYPIIAPKEFSFKEIGETLIEDPDLPLNRHISINLSSLMNDMKKQNMFLNFKLESLKDNKIETSLLGYESALSYIKRMTRSTKAKIEDSFVVLTKDNVHLRIKPIIIIKNKVKRSVMSAMQKKIRLFLADYASQQDFSSIINDIMSLKLNKEIQRELKPVYPLFSILLKAAYKETNIKKQKQETKEVVAESIETPEETEEMISETITEIQEQPEEIKQEKPKKEKKKKE